MTISTELRKAGPFTGNGVTTAFPFSFKVFAASDVTVTRADTLGAETGLVLNTDFTVAINADQGAAPGGTVTLAAPLSTGYRLVVSSAVPNLQPTDITNNGGFYPRVIEDALDRQVAQIQQIAEQAARAVKVKITDTTDPDQLVADLIADAESARTAAAGAASSEANAAASAASASSSESSAAASQSAAASSASAASTSATNAAASASSASASAASAAASQSAAASSEASAQASATTASTKASEAAASAAAAAAAASNAEIAFDSFDDKYLGSKAADPATDNDGNPLLTGALYWNTSVGAVRVWNGAAWLSMAADASIVDFQQAGAGAVVRTVTSKLREAPSQLDYVALADAIAENYNGVLKIKSGTVIDLPSSPITITSPIIIEADGEGSVLLRKTANADAIRVYSPYVKLRGIKVLGSVDGALGFTDTTDGIVIGRNDDANGQDVANGYINAIECELKDVIVEKCGRDNVSWQEGAFLDLNNVHCLSAGRRNFEVSDKSFDASHGVWFTSSAGAVGDGYSIKWGVHHFVVAKSFADGGRGVYINQSRGSTGNVFVELSGGACLEFGPDSLANNINLQFWSAGKNYVDNGIGNKITGMSLGNNNGAAFETFTRTNKLLVKNEFVASGGTVRNGGFLIEQTADNDFSIGDAAYACKLIPKSGGLLLRDTAIGHKVWDLTGFGSTLDLHSGNQHIDNWLLSDGQTLQINGSSGTGYTPYDGQTVTIWLKGAGAASIYGWIAGALQTITITAANTSKTLMWQAAQGYWFIKT